MEVSRETFKTQFINKLETMHGKQLEDTSDAERYAALSTLVRDYIGRKWMKAEGEDRGKQVYYLSIEFLLGRLLTMNLINLGLYDVCNEALLDLGIQLETVEAVEEDPGLGNGGLGRLAACYLDSMAAEGLSGHGCSIRYRFGFFEQQIVNGYQKEIPDDWLTNGFTWEFRRPEEAVTVRFGGQVEAVVNGKLHYVHHNYQAVSAVPYDIPIPGYRNDTVNTLRIWGAEPERESFVCNAVDRNDCLKAAQYKHEIEMLASVLYPDDSFYEGKVLRLKQHYFLVSASLQSIIAGCKRSKQPLRQLPDYVAIHINDTHPALAVPELMRILIDEEGMEWEAAWRITLGTLSYTNHTVLPEALEKWPVDIFQSLLPRLFIIVNEINERFCRDLWNLYPGDWEKIRQMAIVADNQVHMAHLAIVGSHSINGVAEIHTEILKTRVMKNFYEVYPKRFNNKTNGVAHRRWLLKTNDSLARLAEETIGDKWIGQPEELRRLSGYKHDSAFLDKLAGVKHENKSKLAEYIRQNYAVRVDSDAIFDVHIKRIHGYKRQTMNALHIMHLYNLLRDNPGIEIWPRVFIFGGKAAPGYHQAKRTIKLIHTLGTIINSDKSIRDQLKVVFLENYNVSLAELIIPGSDVSEQIPTASREACGTGNMKFMMNGAVTIGTLDGANIEIKNAVGEENIITFGLTAEEVLDYYQHGGYRAWDCYYGNPQLKRVLDQLVNGFLPNGPDEFQPLFDAFLQHNDEFFVLKDFAPYAEAQKKVEQCYRDKQKWRQMCLENIAHSGRFSGDQTFAEYAVDIWKLRQPVTVRAQYPVESIFERPAYEYAMEGKGRGSSRVKL